MTLPLAYPTNAADLYLARREDVSPARPVLTGDIFAAVEIGAEHDGEVLIVAHPCSMRGSGGRLRPRLAAAPIRRYREVPLAEWPNGNYNAFPLPDLFEQPHAALLLELGGASQEDLVAASRTACLSERGIYLLQQRLVHSLTRVTVGVDQLEAASGHVLAEAELEEEWVERLADLSEPSSIADEVAAFQQFFNPFRADFKLRERRADTRRAVRREVNQREESPAAARQEQE